jgi:HTH-type transcriptional regulator/antitoxin HigA
MDTMRTITIDLDTKRYGRLLAKALPTVIQSEDEKHYPLRSSPPHQMVAFLLEQRGLKPSALWPVLGSKGRVSEVLSGKRAISKDQAKKLARFFPIGVELFI